MFARMRAIKREFPIWTTWTQTVLVAVVCCCFATLSPLAVAEASSEADATISKLRGEAATLSCPIDVATCGELHSVKWFKGSDRVAVVSGDGSVQNVESAFGGKVSIEHQAGAPSSNLHIKSVQVSDEDEYLCETTFMDPLDTCDNDGSYITELLINVPPTTIQVLDESNAPILNGTTIGPLRENHRFKSSCEVRSTRPAPTVSWYRAGEKLADTSSVEESGDGLFSLKSELSLILSRQELSSFLECRVETPALPNVVSNQVHIDLQVRPTKVELTGVKHHTVQGTNILLKCLVSGARPAANVTWYNNTVALDPADVDDALDISTQTEFKNDGTFETISKMEFTATRFENGITIRCEADNIVMREDSDKPMHDTLTLEVMYPPVVSVKPDNLTVTESGEFLLFCDYEANPASLKQVRWLKDGALISLNTSRFEGGNPEQTALLIKDANRHDIGAYTCELENGIGLGASENDIDVDVLFAPVVEIRIVPDVPVIENDEVNVTLNCAVTEGNPGKLIGVRWFKDDVELEDIPSCKHDDDDDKVDGAIGKEDNKNDDDDDDDDDAANDDADNDDDDDDDDDVRCGFLVLATVDRDDWGNYSCQGQNTAGWGERSDDEELEIHYEPGIATLVHLPLIAIKRKTVTLTCSVDDGGNPNATRYHWLRGGTAIPDVVTPVWTIDPVGLESRTNFTCYAYNEGGSGAPATVQLDVHAPQTFLQRLPAYTGALYNADEVRLVCQVECVPNCTVTWSLNGKRIDDDADDRYWVESTDVPANMTSGEFESVLSVLHFNMSAWPEERLSLERDNANYTCKSSSASDAVGVHSTTAFSVEYPPENTIISNSTINVVEGLQPPRVTCSARANPEATFEWRRKDRLISRHSVLIISHNVTRSDDGPYICDSFNKHGTHTAMMHMNVMYKPNCTITRKEINDEDVLVCMAHGNPLQQLTFEWSVQEADSNETDTDLLGQDSSDSLPANLLQLDDDFTVQRTYRCVATNAVGPGNYCEIIVDGHLMWWQTLEPMMLYILLGIIAVVVLIIVILLIVCCCCCCKKGKDAKKKASDKMAPQESIDIQDDGEYENLPFHGMANAPNKTHDDQAKKSDTYIY